MQMQNNVWNNSLTWIPLFQLSYNLNFLNYDNKAAEQRKKKGVKDHNLDLIGLFGFK